MLVFIYGAALVQFVYCLEITAPQFRYVLFCNNFVTEFIYLELFLGLFLELFLQLFLEHFIQNFFLEHHSA